MGRGRVVAAAVLGAVAAFASGSLAQPESAPEVPELPFPWPRWDPRPVVVDGTTYRPFGFDGHVHTSYSGDARTPPERMFALAERVRLDGLIITDHGTSRILRDLPRYRGPVKVVVGEEIGGAYGHVVAWNMHDRRGMKQAHSQIARLAPLVHGQGGVVVLAHPGWFMDNRPETPLAWLTPQALGSGGRAEGVDAIEIWNGMYPRPTQMLVERWIDLMEVGTFRPIVASSDFHNGGIHQLGSPRTVAWCADDEAPERCMVQTARRGRAYLTDGPSLHVVVNETLPGGTIEVPAGGPIRIRAWGHAPDGGVLRVWMGRQIVGRVSLRPGRPADGSWEIAAPAQDGFVRAEVVRAERIAKRPMFSAITNPVRVRVRALVVADARKPDDPEPRPPAGPERRALLIGSSSVQGHIGHLLVRELRARGITLEREHRSSSGLARPDFHDWMERLRARGSLAGYAALLIYVGGNDTQQLWLRPAERTPPERNNPNRWIAWRDPRWDEIYRARMRELVDAACAAGVPRVVVLPPADGEPRSAGSRLVRVQTRQLEAASQTRCGTGVDTRAAAGEARRRGVSLTQQDGVHLTERGADLLWSRIGERLLAAISPAEPSARPR